MNKKIPLIAILVLALFLAGCGGECKVDTDCSTAGSCFAATCEDKLCVQTPKGNCCGNGLCETPGEDKGSCPQDCGSCDGVIEGSQHLEKVYDKSSKTCATDLKPGAQSEQSATGKIATGARINLNLVAIFQNPTDIDKDLIKVQLTPDTIPSNVENFKINKVEISGQNSQRQTLILGTSSQIRSVFDESAIEYNIRIKPAAAIVEEAFSNLRAKVFYSYDLKRTTGVTPKTESKEVSFRTVSLTIVDPTITPICPESCDDGNDATKDICSAATDYFCVNTPIPGRCGNYQCDTSETKCSCPQDCGQCIGDAGRYLEFACSASKECGTTLKADTILAPTTVIDEKTSTDFTLGSKYTYDLPFHHSQSAFTLELELKALGENVRNFRITQVRLLESSTLLGEQNPNSLLNSEGSTATVSVPFNFQMTDPEDSKTITVETSYSYDKTTTSGTETKTGKISKGIGRIDIVNPTVE